MHRVNPQDDSGQGWAAKQRPVFFKYQRVSWRQSCATVSARPRRGKLPRNAEPKEKEKATLVEALRAFVTIKLHSHAGGHGRGAAGEQDQRQHDHAGSSRYMDGDGLPRCCWENHAARSGGALTAASKGSRASAKGLARADSDLLSETLNETLKLAWICEAQRFPATTAMSTGLDQGGRRSQGHGRGGQAGL